MYLRREPLRLTADCEDRRRYLLLTGGRGLPPDDACRYVLSTRPVTLAGPALGQFGPYQPHPTAVAKNNVNLLWDSINENRPKRLPLVSSPFPKPRFQSDNQRRPDQS